MNDFSKDTEEFLYSDKYKDKKEIRFLDVSGSMGNFRMLPNVARGGESIEYPISRHIHFYSAETAINVTEAGRCIMNELLEKLSEERIYAKEIKQHGLNRRRD